MSAVRCKKERLVRKQIGDHETLSLTVEIRQLELLGHVARKDGSLEKTCLSGNVEGKRRRGRQKTRWSNGTVKRTERGVEEVVVIAPDRNRWRRFVRESTSAQGPGTT